MPGRTPQDALTAFLEPIREAVRCVTEVRLLLNGNKKGVGEPRSWVLGEGEPIALQCSQGQLYLTAMMHFKIVKADPAKYEDPFRATTTGYLYSIYDESGEQMAFHWHTGNSPVTAPHAHLPQRSTAHIYGPRVSIEEVIFWANGHGAQFIREGAERKLLESKGIFELYRSWSDAPPA